jgi:hypothetical protein
MPNDAYSPENGIVLQGRIVTEVLSIPLEQARVYLEVLDNYNDVYSATTGEGGFFGFEGFDFYDTLSMRIIARKRSGRKNLLIELANFNSPGLKEYYGSFFLTTKSLRDEKAYRSEMARISKEQFRRKEQELEEFYKNVLHGRPDFILYREELNENMTVLQAIVGRVPGVNVTRDKITIRGINSITGNTDPLVLIDDVPADVQILSNIYVRDVDRIEFIKGSSSAIYGIRGANGVIAVYSKRSEFIIKGQIDFELVGYHKPRHFVQSDINKSKNGSDNFPETLIWIPSIHFKNKSSFGIKLKKPEKGKFIHIVLEGVDQYHKPFSETFTFDIQ